MLFRLLVGGALFLVGCQSTQKSQVMSVEAAAPANVIEDSQLVCTNATLEIGFVTCKEIYVNPCGVTMQECSGGSSYYCLHDVICEPKSVADLDEEDLFDLEEGTRGQR